MSDAVTDGYEWMKPDPEQQPDKEMQAILDRILHKMQSVTPEERARREAEEKQRDLDERCRKVDNLRSRWNAPKRHLATNALNDSGKWGETYTKLAGKLNSGFMVALVGTRGSGKTQLAVELMKHSTNQLNDAFYMTAIEFFMTIKQTYKADAKKSELDVMEELKGVGLLVIDEASKRSESLWENLMLFELLDKRYQEMRDTLLISNEAKSDFEKSIGPSLASRMAETGGLVECNWPSFRQ